MHTNRRVGRWALVISSSTQTVEEEVKVEEKSEEKRKHATFLASKRFSQQLEESGRPLREYMALPASQYSVLDATSVERLDGDTFKAKLAGIGFFGFRVEPILTVRVTVSEA